VAVVRLFVNKTLQTKNMAGYGNKHQSQSKLAAA